MEKFKTKEQRAQERANETGHVCFIIAGPRGDFYISTVKADAFKKAQMHGYEIIDIIEPSLERSRAADGPNLSMSPIYLRDLSNAGQLLINVSEDMKEKAEAEGLDIIVGQWVNTAYVE